MARKSRYPQAIAPTDGFEVGMEFLRARRAQNLSWMRLAEQPFSSIAELQKTVGGRGDALAKLMDFPSRFHTRHGERLPLAHDAPRALITTSGSRSPGERAKRVPKRVPNSANMTPPKPVLDHRIWH